MKKFFLVQKPTEVFFNTQSKTEMLKIFRNVKGNKLEGKKKKVFRNSLVLVEVSPGKCIQLRHLKASRTSSG